MTIDDKLNWLLLLKSCLKSKLNFCPGDKIYLGEYLARELILVIDELERLTQEKAGE